MIPDNFASRIFQAKDAWSNMESELFNAILIQFDLDPIDPEQISKAPFEDITTDSYDASFELKDAAPGTVFTSEQLNTFWSWGFSRVWICYSSGPELERYYYSNGVPAGYPKLRAVCG